MRVIDATASLRAMMLIVVELRASSPTKFGYILRDEDESKRRGGVWGVSLCTPPFKISETPRPHNIPSPHRLESKVNMQGGTPDPGPHETGELVQRRIVGGRGYHGDERGGGG